MQTNSAQKIGKPAAMLSAFFAITYSVFALLSIFKFVPYPYSLFWQFLPSLLLAFGYVVTIVCLQHVIAHNVKVYIDIASAFAMLYCACVTVVYFTQIAVVIPGILQNSYDDNHILAFSGKSFMVAVDCIGYALMSISTMFAAFAFKENKNKWLYRTLLYHGLLAPVIIAAFFIPSFIFAGALWMITFPAAMINVAQLFSSKIRTIKKSEIATISDQKETMIEHETSQLQ